MFLSLVLQDYRIPVCAQLLVMMVIAGRLLLLGFVFKQVSWLAGDSRLRQTFGLRIHLVERQSLSSICPSTIISYHRSLEASLSTSASRSIAGPIVFSLDRNKPVTATHRLAPYCQVAPSPLYPCQSSRSCSVTPSYGIALPSWLPPMPWFNDVITGVTVFYRYSLGPHSSGFPPTGDHYPLPQACVSRP